MGDDLPGAIRVHPVFASGSSVCRPQPTHDKIFHSASCLRSPPREPPHAPSPALCLSNPLVLLSFPSSAPEFVARKIPVELSSGAPRGFGYMMSSSTKPTDSTDSSQDEYDLANWTALQEDDNGLSYMGTQVVNATVCNKGKQPSAAQDTRAPRFNRLDQRALNFHHEEVPIGTFKQDHITDPFQRRLVYAKLDKNGKPYYILSSLGTSLLLWCWLCQPQSYGSTPADSPKKRYYRGGDTVYYCLQWVSISTAVYMTRFRMR
ncbi:uncharacterized protein Aud_010566 [Aspergillus udagawae]|uniref:Uncharacterized protein n=1 Tax=Aspergillus udagawae TaxID=91492 RepID=A0A8E0R3B1_9EURO|nr:uncharacterized protein Aud_010566 [Aspergillus udagawae]GIC94071.1 hypothetical protein Aud_010566 [Aspergillus udagawae]